LAATGAFRATICAEDISNFKIILAGRTIE
jgi:hypothetical protein